MSMKCKECGKPMNKSYGGFCQACYRYFKDGGVVHALPRPGTIEYDSEGKVICHICGRSYLKLGSHAKESHDMSVDEYKEKFGLCRNAKITEPNYSARMSYLAYVYNMDEQLKVAGESTRIKPGDNTMRKNKPVRLQEVIDKRNRRIKK